MLNFKFHLFIKNSYAMFVFFVPSFSQWILLGSVSLLLTYWRYNLFLKPWTMKKVFCLKTCFKEFIYLRDWGSIAIVQSPSCLRRQDWSKKLESQSRFFMWVPRTQPHSHDLLPPSCTLAGNWNVEQSQELNSDIWKLNHYAHHWPLL